MEFLTPKRLLALRYACVALSLLATHIILATAAGKEEHLLTDGLMIISFLAMAGVVLNFGMFWPSPGGTGPLWAGTIGCSITLCVLMQERGVSPNWPVVIGFLGLLVAPVLGRVIARALKGKQA